MTCDHDYIGNVCRFCGDDDTALCIDGCGREATTERLTGIIMTGDDFIEVAELCCVYCVDRTESVS